MKRVIIKIFWSILLAIGMFFGGGIIALTLLFWGAGSVYETFFIVACCILYLFVLTCLWDLWSIKRRLIALGTAAAVLATCTIGYTAYSFHVDHIEQVSHEPDLTEYQPFLPGTKAVALQEPATLKLAGSLPRLDGATALYPLYSAFAQAVYPAGTYDVNWHGTAEDVVVCTNTVGAYERLINSQVDIIFAAQPSKQQREMAAAQGVTLQMTPIGREAFVFFVNPQNTVDTVSSSELRSIYSGKLTNWKELGWKNKKIKAFQRPENSGSQTMMTKFMGTEPLMTPPTEEVISGMGGILHEVSAYRNFDNAIGYSFLFFATEMVKNNQIKLLALDGIAPTRENVTDGSYPYTSDFYAVTAGSDNENIVPLLQWILSDQGQQIIEKTGYTPLSSKNK